MKTTSCKNSQLATCHEQSFKEYIVLQSKSHHIWSVHPICLTFNTIPTLLQVDEMAEAALLTTCRRTCIAANVFKLFIIQKQNQIQQTTGNSSKKTLPL